MTIKSLTHSLAHPNPLQNKGSIMKKERKKAALSFLSPPPLVLLFFSCPRNNPSLPTHFVGIPHPRLSVWPSLWKRTSWPFASCPTAVLADSTFTNLSNVPIGKESIQCAEEHAVHAQRNKINRITRPLA